MAIDSQKDTRERLANSTTTSTTLPRPPPPPPKGRGMQMRPPPFFGTWDDYKKKSLKTRLSPTLTLKNGAICCAFPSKVFIAEMNRNLSSIPRALSTWMILKVWELTGCVVGVPKMEHTNISTHLCFHHL